MCFFSSNSYLSSTLSQVFLQFTHTQQNPMYSVNAASLTLIKRAFKKSLPTSLNKPWDLRLTKMHVQWCTPPPVSLTVCFSLRFTDLSLWTYECTELRCFSDPPLFLLSLGISSSDMLPLQWIMSSLTTRHQRLLQSPCTLFMHMPPAFKRMQNSDQQWV